MNSIFYSSLSVSSLPNHINPSQLLLVELALYRRCFLHLSILYKLLIKRLIYIIMCCVKVHEQVILGLILISGWKTALDLNLMIAVHLSMSIIF